MRYNAKWNHKGNQSNHKHHVMLIQILLSCLLCLSLASADTMTIAPLDETEFTNYYYYIQQGDVVISLPIKWSTDVLADDSDEFVLLLNNPDDETGVYAFFSLHSPLTGEESISSLTESQIQSLLDTISSNPAALTYTQENDAMSVETYLRVVEYREGIYTEHLLALHNGWLLNSMFQKTDGSTTLTADEQKLQQDTLSSADYLDQDMPRLQEYTFVNSEIELDLPASFFLTTQLDERDENVILVSHKRPGTVLSTLTIRSVYNSNLINKNVATMDETLYDIIIDQLGISGDQSLKDAEIVKGFYDDTPVLIYGDSASSRNMLAFRDGWAIRVSLLENEYIDSVWSRSVQDAMMRQLLGSPEAIPEYLPATQIQREGNTLLFPLMTRTLTIQIPDGYSVDIGDDVATQRTVYLTNESDSNKYIIISSIGNATITGDAPLTALFSDEDLTDACETVTDGFADNGVDVTGATSKVQEQGLLETPTIFFADKNGQTLFYTWMMDSYNVSVTFTSDGKPISAKEHKLLYTLFRDTVMQSIR
jgi:hypothetical protein